MDCKDLITLLREYAGCCTRGLSRAAIADYFEQSATAIETLLAERDAAVKELLAFWTCGTCKNLVLNRPGAEPCPFRLDCNGQHWKWRGPQKEDGGDA